MPTIIYVVENTNEQDIERYFENNNNLPELNFNEYDEEKPSVNKVDDTTLLVINNETEKPGVRKNTVEKAIEKYDEIIIPVTSISIPEIQNLLAEDVNVHLPRAGLVMTRHKHITNEILDQLTPLTDDDVIRRHTGGRAPLGTRIEDGFIVQSDDYDEVRETLKSHVEGDVSKEQAAERLGTTPRTIQRASERDELYRLQ